MDAASLQFNPADPMEWRERLVQGGAPEALRLAAAAQEFEAVLLRHYLSEALRPVTESGALFGGNNQVYSYLITDSLARGLSAGGVFGFSSLLQAQLAGDRDIDHDEHSDPL